MKLAQWVLAGAFAVASGGAFASKIVFNVVDFSPSARASEFELYGECQQSYYGPYKREDCGYGDQPYTTKVLQSTSEKLAVHVTNLLAKNALTTGFDYYFLFRDANSTAIAANDVLRYRLELVNPDPAREFSNAEMTIELVSGSLVDEFIAQLPSTSLFKGTLTSAVDQDHVVVEGFSTMDWERGSFGEGIRVISNSVSEPTSAALVVASLLGLAARGRRPRPGVMRFLKSLRSRD